MLYRYFVYYIYILFIVYRIRFFGPTSGPTDQPVRLHERAPVLQDGLVNKIDVTYEMFVKPLLCDLSKRSTHTNV